MKTSHHNLNSDDDDANDFHGLNDFMQTKKGRLKLKAAFCTGLHCTVFTFALLHNCELQRAALHTCLFNCCTANTVAPHSSLLHGKIAHVFFLVATLLKHLLFSFVLENCTLVFFSCCTANTFGIQFCTGNLHTFQTPLHCSLKILNNIAQSIASLRVQRIYARKRYSPCGPVQKSPLH